MIAQLFIVYKIPLSPCILVTPSVTFTRKINPLRMTKFITHEIQITAVDGGSRKQTNHFMQGYTAFYGVVLISFLKCQYMSASISGK